VLGAGGLRRSSKPVVARPELQGRVASPSLTWILAAGLLVLTALTYASVRTFGFVELDDPLYITENPHVRAGLTLEGVRWAFATNTAAHWHPLTWLSHMLDVSMFGVASGPHHVVNLLLHMGSTVILFLLLHRLTASPWRSAFVAAVFALHPLRVESVAWVAERKDVLSTFFWMLTTAAYVSYCRHQSRTRMAAVAGFFVLGLLSKAMLVTLPFVLVLLDLWPLERWSIAKPRTIVPMLKEKLPLFALSAASSVATVVAARSNGEALAGLQELPLGLRLANAVISALAYLRKMFWPTDLNLLYALPDEITSAQLAGAALVLLTITVVVFRSARSRPYLLVGWLWYLGTLVPVSGLMQLGAQAMADRYTYIPMIGIALMVAWLPSPSMMRSTFARTSISVAAGLAVVSMIVATSNRLPVWRNNVTLFTAATMQTMNVDEYGAHLSLGATLMGQQRFEEARAHYEAANALQPKSSEALYGIGLSYLNAGRAADAIRSLEQAVALAPDDPGRRNDLAVAYVRSERIDDAIREYRRLTAQVPGEPRFSGALSALLARRRT
jgi:protein O-mannosyl-transferase